MSAETRRFDDHSPEAQNAEQLPASPVTALLLWEKMEAVVSNGNLQEDGSRELTVYAPSESGDDFDDELHITKCPADEASIDGIGNQLGFIYHYLRQCTARYDAAAGRSVHDLDPDYRLYHILERAEGIVILKTPDNIDDEANEPTLWRDGIEAVLQQAVQRRRRAEYGPEANVQPATEAEALHLLKLLKTDIGLLY